MTDWILAIDTSTEACSCALGNGKDAFFRYTDIPRKHAEKVLPMVDELLEEAGIERTAVKVIAFGRGPGAFTGLRIAASVVQGLGFALDIPVIPISSLQVLAQRGYREFNQMNTIAAIDARMGEIYWAAYQLDDQGVMQPASQEYLTSPESMSMASIDAEIQPHLSGVGTGWQYQSQMPSGFSRLIAAEANIYTHALDVLTLARPLFDNNEWVDVEKAIPTYIRNNVAHQKPPAKAKN